MVQVPSLNQHIKNRIISDTKIGASKNNNIKGMEPSGVGVALSLEQTALKHSKNIVVGYKLFDKSHRLIKVYERRIKNRNIIIKGLAIEDGYVQTFLIDKNNPLSVLGGIGVSAQIERIVYNDNLQGTGSEDFDEPDFSFNANGITFNCWDFNHDGFMDQMGYSIGGQVYVLSLSSYPNIPSNSYADVMEGYYPNAWPSVNDYLLYLDNSYNQGTNSTSTPVVQNNLSNNCLKQSLTNALSLGTSNPIMQKLNLSFTSSSTYKLSYNDFSSLPNGWISHTNFPDAQNIIYTDLSSGLLSIASKEAIAEVILHEMLHAYMETQPALAVLSQQAAHEYMLQNYTNDIASSLKSMFPGMSDNTALSLALGGYDDVQSDDPTFWNTILAQFNLNSTAVNNIVNSNLSGSSGTSCN